MGEKCPEVKIISGGLQREPISFHLLISFSDNEARMAWPGGRVGFPRIPLYPLASPVSFVASGSYHGFSDKLFIFTWFGYEKRDDRFLS
jgi:hypothetical protein